MGPNPCEHFLHQFLVGIALKVLVLFGLRAKLKLENLCCSWALLPSVNRDHECLKGMFTMRRGSLLDKGFGTKSNRTPIKICLVQQGPAEI